MRVKKFSGAADRGKLFLSLFRLCLQSEAEGAFRPHTRLAFAKPAP